MKAIVKKDACIGCGACASIESEVFEINDEGVATVKVEELPEEKTASASEAAESCPTGAIVVE